MRNFGEIRMKSFWEYYRGVFIRPRRKFASLLVDPRRLAYGSAALLISAILYSLVILFLALAGGLPAIPPLLTIPAQDYYFLQVLFMPLVMFSAWILASGVAQLISKPFWGGCTFENTLSLLGFGIAVPTYVMPVPDGLSGDLLSV